MNASNFHLFRNPSLTNLDGFSNITNAVIGEFHICGNNALSNLDGLSGVIRVTEDLSICDEQYGSGNPNLANCSGIAGLLNWPTGTPNNSVGGDIYLQGNATGCNSIQQILASVSGPTAPEITSTDTKKGYPILKFTPSTTEDPLWTITDYQAQCMSDEQHIFQNNTVTPIPNESFIDSPLNISNVPFKNSAGLTIPVNITHPRTRHLSLILTSPSGTSVILWDEAVGNGTGLIGTFPSTLTPAESLDAFNGENFNGLWQLTVTDGVASQTGTLNS